MTPSQPSDNTNTGNSGNTDSGTSTQPSENNGTTPSNPSESGGGTDNGSTQPSDNGNTGTTEHTTPSENGNTGNTDNGNSGNTDSGNTDNGGTSTDNGSTDNPSDNSGSTNTGSNTTPSENSGTTTQPDAPIVRNFIELNNISDIQEGEETNIILNVPVYGKVGEKIRLGDVIPKYISKYEDSLYITKDGNIRSGLKDNEEDGVIYTLVDSQSSISDYVYTIKEEGHEEVIPVKEKRLSENTGNTETGNTTPTQPSDNGNTGNTETGTTQPTEEPTVTNNIVVKGKSDNSFSNNTVLLTIPVKGKVGETVRVGDFITPELLAENAVSLDDDCTVITYNYTGYKIGISPNLKDLCTLLKKMELNLLFNQSLNKYFIKDVKHELIPNYFRRTKTQTIRTS